MKLVNGIRRWSVLILVSALVVTVPLTVAEARGGGHGGGGGGRGGGGGGRAGFGGGAGRGGFVHGGGFGHGGFGHGFRGHGFARGGFRGRVVIGLGGWWWDPWWYGGYWPYAYGAPGYAGYGYPAYPYGGYYDTPYAYAPEVPPAAYNYGVETFQAPPEPPPAYPAPSPYQGPPPVSYGVPPPGAPPTASLQIEVIPGETEILVDGARVGRAKEFQGPVRVPVAAGAHALGFRVSGVATIENIVVSPQTTVLIKRDLGATVAPQQ